MLKKNKSVFLAALTAVIAIVGGVAVIYGHTIVHGQTQLSQQGYSQDQLQQMINGRLTEISQMQHKTVCDVANGNNAACAARVVIGSDGRARSAASPSAASYGPKQFLTAYGLTGLSSASPVPLIAIVDAYDDPNITSDLNTYDSYYHNLYGSSFPASFPTCTGSITTATSTCFQKINESGKTSPLPQSNPSWALEISLDVEIAHATCQNCRILLVEANSASYSDLFKAVNTAVADKATVVSGSWGGSETSNEKTYDSNFATTSVAFTFSAGDGGYGTLYPAASPYVTAVGGTTLLMSTTTPSIYLSESAWSGTGSGCSLYETRPSWQTNTIDPSCTKRTMNDVSADANPATGAAVYDSVRYDNTSGWFQVGGTSLSSPLIAAIYALQGIPGGSTWANSLPYAGLGNSSKLHDVKTGSNGSCHNSYLCTATSGYDGPTGVGTPNGISVF